MGWHLARLAGAVALPAFVFSAVVLFSFGNAERGRLEQRAEQTARSTAAAVGRELTALGSALGVLALSPTLRAGDLEAFHRQASEVRQRLGINAVLTDATGQQLVNSRAPWGAALPRSNFAPPDPGALATGRPVVSGVFTGAVAKEPLFVLHVGLPPDAGLPGVALSLSLPAERVREILLGQNAPLGWTVAVVDGEGRILARNRQHAAFVGRPATADLLEATSGGEAGSWRGTTAEGAAVFGAYARVPEAGGWRVAVGVPERLLGAPLRRSLAALMALGVTLLALSAGLAFVFARRIAGPAQALAERAARLGRGEEVPALASPVREAAAIGAALAAASRELRAREAELRQLNAGLEARVEARTRELAEANARLRAEAAEREAAEGRLRQAQKMEAVGRLTGGIAHDFNNLLTVVIGNLGLLRDAVERSGDARALRRLEGAAEGARRAATLTQGLLAFSRQQPLAPTPLDCNQLVAGMSDLVGRTLGEVVAVETALAEGLWLTLADPNQLESAILNLAVNARDAMPGGGRLRIETANETLPASHEAPAGDYVVVSVSDSGSGMTPEVAAQAFEPFFTTKPVGEGTGLGLSQVYGFVRQSGGHAAIRSKPGKGTTVRLCLPRLAEEASNGKGEAAPAPRPAPAPGARPPEGRGELLLLVEDDALVRDFTASALKGAGYRVETAATGPEALRLLDAGPGPALLVTDVVLAGPMDGRAVAEAARRRRPGLPVLFVTGYAREALREGRLEPGVELLAKPFAAEELAGRVAALLAEWGGGMTAPGDAAAAARP